MKHLLISVFMATLCVWMCLSCASSRRAGASPSLAGEWEIETIDGLAIDRHAGETVPFLGFDIRQKRVWGSTSCNRLTGVYRAGTDSLDLGQLGCTMKMCQDMDVEQRVLAALARVRKYSLDDSETLVLTTGEGTAVMVLQKRK